MADRIRVTVWGENVHERKNAIVAQIYPDGMHNCIAQGLAEDRALRVARHIYAATSATWPNEKRSG